jgi:hypothetical protein
MNVPPYYAHCAFSNQLRESCVLYATYLLTDRMKAQHFKLWGERIVNQTTDTTSDFSFDAWRAEVNAIIAGIGEKSQQQLARGTAKADSSGHTAPMSSVGSRSESAIVLDTLPSQRFCHDTEYVEVVEDDMLTSPAHPNVVASLCSACVAHAGAFDDTWPAVPLCERPWEERLGREFWETVSTQCLIDELQSRGVNVQRDRVSEVGRKRASYPQACSLAV